MSHRGSRHALSHAAIYFVARGLPGVIAFLAIPLFTRLLEPKDYGRYALVIACVNLLNALLFQWLRLSLLRFLPAYKGDEVRLKSTLFFVGGVIILILGAVASMLLLFPIAPDWRPVILPCWAVLAVQVIFELCCEYSRAGLQPWRYMVLQVTRTTLAIALGVTFVLVGMGWWGPLLGTGAGMAIASAIVWRRDWSDLRLQHAFDRDILKKVCAYGLPLSLTVALAIVVASSDRFLIAWFLGEDAAGLYSVAIDFTAQTLTLLLMVIYMAMFPIAVRAWEEHGHEATRDAMRMNASMLLAVGVPCVVGLAILAPGISHVFLGKSFREAAAQIIPLVALGTFLAGLKACHFDAAFQFAHRTIHQVWIVLFVAIVNIVLNMLAIPRWGIEGAAGASALAYALSIGITVVVGRRHLKLPFPIKPFAQVLIAAGAMTVLLVPLRQFRSPSAVVAQIAGAAMLYGVVLIATNFLRLRGHLIEKIRSARPAPVRAIEPTPALAEAQ